MSDAGFNCEVMSWDLFNELSEKVAKIIILSQYQPDLIIGLARGGWVLSRVLCDHLKVKDLVSLKVEHWGITATPDGKALIKYPFEHDLSNRKVLVVDDITDTGESMIVAMDYIIGMNPGEVRSAALLHIKGSKFTPDYFGDEITWRWIVFPWNFVEDMCNIIPKVLEAGDSTEEIKKNLKVKFNIEISDKKILEIKKEIKRRAIL
jgi:hypoxanthine phosphoribosyltransferase